MLGVFQRGDERVIRMLENVQQATISPILRALITPGTRVYTDEYDILPSSTVNRVERHFKVNDHGTTLKKSYFTT